jgi:hypothetical protein
MQMQSRLGTSDTPNVRRRDDWEPAWTAALLPSDAGGSAFKNLVPDASTWQARLRSLVEVEVDGGAGSCTIVKDAWALSALMDHLEALAAARWRMRIGPVHVLTVCSPDVKQDTHFRWHALVCFYVPGQPRGRCASLAIEADLHAPDPAGWRFRVTEAQDAGVLPEAALLSLPGLDGHSFF